MHIPKKDRERLKRGVVSANKQKASMAIFTSHKVDFKVKVTVKQYKYILMIKGNIHKIFYRHRKLSCINNIILKYAKH